MSVLLLLLAMGMRGISLAIALDVVVIDVEFMCELSQILSYMEHIVLHIDFLRHCLINFIIDFIIILPSLCFFYSFGKGGLKDQTGSI